MTDAPERIFAWYARSQDGEWLGQHCATDRKPNAQGAAEYIRADLHQQALAKAEAWGYARAVEVADGFVGHDAGAEGATDAGEGFDLACALISDRLRALSPSTPPRDDIE